MNYEDVDQSDIDYEKLSDEQIERTQERLEFRCLDLYGMSNYDFM